MSDASLRLTLLEKDGDQPDDMDLGQSMVKPLGPSGSLVIGRAPLVDILVRAPSVGRQVVRVTMDESGPWVRDLGSGGGSALEADGVVTHRPDCRLPDQAILRVGRVAFRVEVVRG